MLILVTNRDKCFWKGHSSNFYLFPFGTEGHFYGVIVAEFSTEQLDANFATYRNQSFPMHMNMILFLRKSTKEKYLHLL